MISIEPFSKKDAELARAVEDYYNVAPPEELADIAFAIFDPRKTLEERKKSFREHKDKIQKLVPLFKQIVIERNRVFPERDEDSYFDFVVDDYGVPGEKLELFFGRLDNLINYLSSVYKSSLFQKDWFWTKYNLPLFSFYRVAEKLDYKNYKFSRLKERIKTELPELAEFLSRIDVKELDADVARTRFDQPEGRVTVAVKSSPINIRNVSTFLHELSHAFVILSLVDRENINPSEKTEYWHEEQAMKIEKRLRKVLLPQKVQNILLWDNLRVLCFALFEKEIYKYPEKDFGKVYAQAINTCYPQAEIKESPFYVLNYHFLVNRPGYAVVASVARAETLDF